VWMWPVLFSRYIGIAPYIYALSRLESGDFSNTLSTGYNNIFSMKYPTKRPSLNTGSILLDGVDGGDYVWSVYSGKSQAVRDFLLWLDYNNAPISFSSSSQFISFLKSKGYFEMDETQYLQSFNSKL